MKKKKPARKPPQAVSRQVAFGQLPAKPRGKKRKTGASVHSAGAIEVAKPVQLVLKKGRRAVLPDVEPTSGSAETSRPR